MIFNLLWLPALLAVLVLTGILLGHVPFGRWP